MRKTITHCVEHVFKSFRLHKITVLLIAILWSTFASAQIYLTEDFDVAWAGSPVAPPTGTQSRIINIGNGTPQPTGTVGEKDWVQNVNTGAGVWTQTYGTASFVPSAAFTGTGAAWFENGNFGGTGTWFGARRLETATMDLSASTSPYLRFYMFWGSTAGTNIFRVVASNDGGVTWNSISVPTSNSSEAVAFGFASPWDRINVLIPAAYRVAGVRFGLEITNNYFNPNPFIDNFVIEEYTPTTITASATGNWSATATWAGGIVPNADNHVVIPAGITVSTDVNAARCQDMTVQGTFQFALPAAGVANVAQIFGNLDVQAGGTFNAFNAALGKTVFLGGNFINNGTITFNVGAPILWFAGGEAQTYSGTGVITGGRIIQILCVNDAGLSFANAVTVSAAAAGVPLGLMRGVVNGTNLTIGGASGGATQTVQRGTGSMTPAPIFDAGVTFSTSYVTFFAQKQGGLLLFPSEEIPLISGVRNVRGTLLMSCFNNLELTTPVTVGTGTAGVLTMTRGIIINNTTNVLTINNTSSTGSLGTAPSQLAIPTTHGSYVTGAVRINFGATTTTRNFPMGVGTSFNGPVRSSNVRKEVSLLTTVAWTAGTIPTVSIETAPSGSLNTPITSLFGNICFRVNLNGGPDLPTAATITIRGNNYTHGGGGNSDNMIGEQGMLRVVQSTLQTGAWSERSVTLGGAVGFVDNTFYPRTTVAGAPGPIAPLGTNGEYFALATTLADCAGTPAPGNTLTTATNVCSGQAFTLSLQNLTVGVNVSYQWQSGPSNVGPWTNVGTNASIYTTSQAVVTWYQCVVTCTPSGLSGTSNPVNVIMTPINTFPYTQDFESGAGDWTSGGTNNNWNLGDPATGAIPGVINIAASGGTNSWETDINGTYLNSQNCFVTSPPFDFTGFFANTISADVWRDAENSWDGSNFQFSVNAGSSWTTIGALGSGGTNWYNDNTISGLAFSGSQHGWTGAGGGWVTATHNLPSALDGQSCVLFRVTFGSDASVISTDGFAFDNINITVLTPCAGTPTPGNTTTTSTNVCSGQNFTLGLQNATTGTGVSYQWQSGPSNVGPWTNVGPDATTYTTNQAGATWYQCVVTCSFSGFSGTSTPVLVDMPINTFPYAQNFESGAAGWSTGGTNNNWQLGTPASGVINTPAPGGTMSWETDLAGTYLNNQQCWIQSPAFDFTSISPSETFFDIFYNCENSWDGSNFQFSLNQGASWTTIGAVGDPTNWYTDATVNGLAWSGSQSGWTGAGTGWVTATHDISTLGLTGQSCVLFRFTFGSDASVISTDGMGFDNFNISIPCTGTPNPGNTVSSINPVCPTANFTLSLQNLQASGSTYQWQSGPSSSGPWTNVGPNAATYTTSQIVATWYQCIVTCTSSGLSATSNPLQETIISAGTISAGPDQTVYAGNCVMLNGSYSNNIPMNPVASYDFNSGLQGWTVVDNPGCSANFPTIWGSQAFGYGGTMSAGVPTIAGDNGSIVSPTLTLGGGSTVSFRSWTNNENGFPCFYDAEHVEFSTNGGATWTGINPGNPTLTGIFGDAQWRQFSYSFNASGTNCMLRFRYDTGDNCCGPTSPNLGWYVDDVAISTGGTIYAWTPTTGLSCTDCLTPTACPTGTTTYTLSVTDGTCTLIDAVTVTVLPALNDNCVNAITLVESEYGFFSTLNCANNYGSNILSTIEAGEPTMCVTLNNSVWYKLITPSCGASVYNFVFSTDNTGTTYDTAIDLFQSPDGTCNFAQFVPVMCNDDNTAGGCNGVGLSLPSTINVTGLMLSGQTYYLRVDGYASATGNFNLTVEMNPFAPTLTAGIPATTSINASWPSAAANHYDLYWKITGSPGYASQTGIAGTAYSIMNLMPGTSYDVELKNVCIPNGIEHYYAPVSTLITAPSSCASPGTPTCVFIGNNTITIGWTNVPAAVHYKIFWRKVGQFGNAVVNNVPAGSTQHTFSGLLQGTAYEFWVRAVCEPGNPNGNVTGPHGFCTTLGVPRLSNIDDKNTGDYEYNFNGVTYTNWDPADLNLDEYLNNLDEALIEIVNGELQITDMSGNSLKNQDVRAMNIYPNPASSSATLEITLASAGEVAISVYDVQGKLVKSFVVSSSNTQLTYTISLEDMPSGMYNVVANTGSDVQTRKLAVIK